MAETKPKCPICSKVVERTISYRQSGTAVFAARPCGHTLTAAQHISVMRNRGST